MIKIIIARKISLIFVAIGIVTHAAHHENTDGNKLVIFSGMYYGDNYVTVCMWYIVLSVQSRKKEEEDKLAEVMEGKTLYIYLHDVILPSPSNVNLIREHS